jgi:GT2 family glycosyltransferase
MIDLSISIVNTNNWGYLESCLRSIIENTHNISYEILVVDNASNDNSVESIKEIFPQVILSVNKARHGFAKNNNINLEKSTGRYLMLLNDDTLVLPGSLENAISYLEANKDVGMIGCKMLSPDGSVQFASGRRLPILITILWKELGLSYRFNKNPIFAWHTIGNWDHNSLHEIELPSEAGLIVRKTIIDEVGLLDEHFFMYGEGADWARRIKKYGCKVMFFPDCSIIHFGNVTNQRSGNIKTYEQYYKSTYLYFRKESLVAGVTYQSLITLIFSIKYLIYYFLYIVSLGNYKPYPDIFTFYRATIRLMLFKLQDANYPFSTM